MVGLLTEDIILPVLDINIDKDVRKRNENLDTYLNLNKDYFNNYYYY